jgi:hypothetical protein
MQRFLKKKQNETKRGLQVGRCAGLDNCIPHVESKMAVRVKGCGNRSIRVKFKY